MVRGFQDKIKFGTNWQLRFPYAQLVENPVPGLIKWYGFFTYRV